MVLLLLLLFSLFLYYSPSFALFLFFLSLCILQAKDARAHANVHSEVGMLRTKATDKLRDFLMTSILSLRKANANYDVIQQTTLLRFKHFMLFLIDHSPEHALEIRREYTDTMSKIYYSRFKEYLSKVRHAHNTHATLSIKQQSLAMKFKNSLNLTVAFYF